MSARSKCSAYLRALWEWRSRRARVWRGCRGGERASTVVVLLSSRCSNTSWHPQRFQRGRFGHLRAQAACLAASIGLHSCHTYPATRNAMSSEYLKEVASTSVDAQLSPTQRSHRQLIAALTGVLTAFLNSCMALMPEPARNTRRRARRLIL